MSTLAFAGYAIVMSSKQSNPEGVDRPEPGEALAEPTARKRDHEPTDQDDRELLLDDPALPEIAIDDDDTRV